MKLFFASAFLVSCIACGSSSTEAASTDAEEIATAAPASLQRRAPGTCAGRCGGRGTERCYCDETCSRKKDCCGDFAPLCTDDALGGSRNEGDLVFDRRGSDPRFTGEDWSGNTIRYDYRRLTDIHPECVERTGGGGSRVSIVMRSQLGGEAPVEQVVAGFSTPNSTAVTLHREVAFPVRGVYLNLRFRCGNAPADEAPVDDNAGAGYSVYVMR